MRSAGSVAGASIRSTLVISARLTADALTTALTV
jgi:hypothetical protein